VALLAPFGLRVVDWHASCNLEVKVTDRSDGCRDVGTVLPEVIPVTKINEIKALCAYHDALLGGVRPEN
jgi:hypothetical protein